MTKGCRLSERVLACVACCCNFPSRLDFGATPRDEIHLLCLLIKDKPIKLTSGYCFTCEVERMLLPGPSRKLSLVILKLDLELIATESPFAPNNYLSDPNQHNI